MKLSKCTLSRIMVFNKKRSGEVGNISVDDFTRRRDWGDENSEEIKSTMIKLERKLMERMILIYIVCKRERNVRVLLTAEMKRALDVLLSFRKKHIIDHK